MKVASTSYELATGDIEVMSNLTTITANANRISRLEAVKGKESPAKVYLDLKVKPHPEHLPSVLGETEEVDLVMSPDDALEIGIMMVAMGLENKSQLEVDEVFKRLFELTCELHNS
ncbi:MAG: hypothetical protein AAGE96_02230 [Cyanobacteria bacterium P01_G01_bin.19]